MTPTPEQVKAAKEWAAERPDGVCHTCGSDGHAKVLAAECARLEGELEEARKYQAHIEARERRLEEDYRCKLAEAEKISEGRLKVLTEKAEQARLREIDCWNLEAKLAEAEKKLDKIGRCVKCTEHPDPWVRESALLAAEAESATLRSSLEAMEKRAKKHESDAYRLSCEKSVMLDKEAVTKLLAETENGKKLLELDAAISSLRSEVKASRAREEALRLALETYASMDYRELTSPELDLLPVFEVRLRDTDGRISTTKTKYPNALMGEIMGLRLSTPTAPKPGQEKPCNVDASGWCLEHNAKGRMVEVIYCDKKPAPHPVSESGEGK